MVAALNKFFVVLDCKSNQVHVNLEASEPHVGNQVVGDQVIYLLKPIRRIHLLLDVPLASHYAPECLFLGIHIRGLPLGLGAHELEHFYILEVKLCFWQQNAENFVHLLGGRQAEKCLEGLMAQLRE